MILLFVNLHVHTEWSLLDGMCRIEDLVPRVVELGQNAVAITDHGVMHGVVQFYRACRDYKDPVTKEPRPIKPIIGMEAYVVPDILFHLTVKQEIDERKDARKKMSAKEKKAETGSLSVKDAFSELAENDERFLGNSVVVPVEEDGAMTMNYRFANAHLLLLAKDMEGYKNLCQIATDSQLEGFYGKPRIDIAHLAKYGKGIIATSACLAGEIPRLILRGRIDLAELKVKQYQEIFDEFYLEIQPNPSPEQRIINQALIEMSERIGVPLVATSDAHYVRQEDSVNHDVLLSVATDDKFSFDEKVYFIHSEEEMLAAGMPQSALDNTQAIADKCNVEFQFGKTLLPRIDIPAGYDANTYISKLAYDGFYKFMSKNDIDVDLYTKRLEYELSVVIGKGLSDYLLIVQDFLNWARKNQVFVGPGRGSAVGSLVCFCLGITTLDPIKYNLMFERFLNPDRPSFPDVDSDFEEYITIDDDFELSQIFKSGRQTVLEYVISKYGAECICQIGTFGTMGTRSVLKDVGRALSSGKQPGEEGYIDHNEINTITKFVPMESGKQWTLSECLYGNPEKERMPVVQIVDYSRQHPKLFEVALKLEGMPRHPSIHAAGVVICPVPVRDLIPLMRGGAGEVVAQFEMSIIEELGLLKMDFLGLRTLGALHKTVDLIALRHGEFIDMDEIPLDDSAAMKLIASGYTDGVFQVESDGMKKMFKDMAKVNFDNIVAGIALYRPGPMQFIPRYVSCLNGYSQVSYKFPELEPILKDTYGVMVYQEQLMLVAKDIAGFDWITVDGYRKAVGKKKESLIKKMNGWLVDGHNDDDANIHIPGLVNVGVPKELAEELADEIVSFGSYCFNKSHAAGYAKIVVITAYLKAHYPIEYMTPLISSYIGKDPEKVTQYINEAKRMGIRILPPSINGSEFEFSIEGAPPYPSDIRYGLGAIKGLSKAALLIYEERLLNGAFVSLTNFLDRFGKKELNKKVLDVLCLSGALDDLCREEQPYLIMVNESADPLEIISEPIVENGVVNRLKLLQQMYNLRGYGSIDSVLETYSDNENSMKMKKKYSKIQQSAEQMAVLSAEHGLLGMYISSHPLDGKATPVDWGSYSHGGRFDCVGIIRNVHTITTRFGKPMAFVTIETLEGMKEPVMFTKEYEANEKKLEVGGIRVFTLEIQMRDGSFSCIVKNVKYYKD